MTERPKVHDWKSCVHSHCTEGSNPSLSAIECLMIPLIAGSCAMAGPQIPPGPEGSNGSSLNHVPQGCLAINGLIKRTQIAYNISPGPDLPGL